MAEPGEIEQFKASMEELKRSLHIIEGQAAKGDLKAVKEGLGDHRAAFDAFASAVADLLDGKL